MFLNRKNINTYLFDVDGTILVEGEILESTIEAIADLREEGNMVMIATGRCHGQLKEVLDKIDVDGIVQNNGALAYMGKEILFSSPIDPEIIKQMVNDNLNLAVLTKDKYVRFINTNKCYKKFAESLNLEEPKKAALDLIDNEPIYSLNVCDTDISKINIKKYPGLKFVKVSDYGYDAVNVGVNKASCFDAIEKKYPQGHIVAFGDNLNDLEMLDEAYCSVCMPTAPDACKKASSYVTRDAKLDGIAFAINNFVKRVLE